jgi:2-C-methyl-D-erythritol 4-phosphate cytidylyltransferase/2-C-methyl-D-erythritol 2,4-cyclodiphosphate synthase
MTYSVGVIICAAGKGLRAKFGKNKLLAPLGEKTVLEKTLSAFDFPAISQIVVAAAEDELAEISALCSPFPRTQVVVGGNTRSRSVYNALSAINTDIVLIHDGARPFISRESIENCIHSVKTFGSGVCAVDCLDTIAQKKDGRIFAVVNRDEFCHIQTPQGFFRENIFTAYKLAFQADENASFTDDSSVFAQYCGKPHLCAGARDNIKLTYAEDFKTSTARCGVGIDTHAFGKEQPFIVLAGVKIPSHSGLVAHSDGDVLTHAVMDALLSAAGLDDIGHYFPDTDDKWKNANSLDMLNIVVKMLRDNGYAVQNLSVAVQAQTPRLAEYIDDMKNNLASVLRIDPNAVGISAGTNEGLGYVGEGKGITVHAFTLLKDI